MILWATSMIDTDSPNYAEGKAKGYYLNDGKTVKWWHGKGPPNCRCVRGGGSMLSTWW